MFREVLTYWLVLSGLYWTMAWGGGIEWIHKRDSGPFGRVEPAVWKKVWHLIFGLGTAALALSAVHDVLA